jgi:hypothetical protein
LSAAPQGPPEAGPHGPAAGGPLPCPPEPHNTPDETVAAKDVAGATLLLGALPVGARLILRCRKDWRAAAVAAYEPDRGRVVLSVASPTGHTYRVRRPADSVLTPDGPLPVLGGGVWRACFARYDLRW